MQLDARVKSLVNSVFGSAAARLINLIIALALVPLTINALSPTDYAILAMAISFSVLSAYADLGLGLAIVNTLASESEKPNPRRSQRAIAVVWFTLVTIAAFGLLAVTGLGVGLFYFNPVTESTHWQVILMGVACILVGLPSGLMQRILFARHKIVEANIWATAGRITSLGAVWVAVAAGVVNLPWLVFSIIGIPVIVSWLSVFIVFKRRGMRVLIPRWRNYDGRLLKPYLVTGMSFVVMQMVPYVEVGIDTVLAGMLVNIAVVPALDVYIRLFTYVPALISIALVPLWPVVVTAKSDGDLAWIRKIHLLVYFLVGGLSFSVSAAFVVYGRSIILYWIGQDLILPPTVLLGFGVFAVLICLGSAQSMLLNGVGIIRKQASLYLIYVCALLFFKSAAALLFGLEGMIIALVLCCISRLYFAEKLLRASLSK